jgi:tRNA(Ile)-lysidine synthase
VRGARPLAALEAAVAENVRPRPGEVLVAAVSGGADSVALGALLARSAASAGASVVFAHVNHALRTSAWQDEAVVLALGAACAARVVAVSLPPGPADEARLRDERYAALAGVARTVGAQRIFTGHHAADQTETVLLALFRGAGPAGLTGMHPERELEAGLELVRPLLDVEPATLRAYCAALHLPVAIDPTNADSRYRRNALRATLDSLRVEFPHLDAAVARCARILREERAETATARIRENLRVELVALEGDAREVTFERLDSVARAVERGRRGRHFLRRGVEAVVE